MMSFVPVTNLKQPVLKTFITAFACGLVIYGIILFLFPVSGIILLKSILTGLALSLTFAALAHFASKGPRFVLTAALLLAAFAYLMIRLAPESEQGIKPSKEIRTAVSGIVQYDALPEALIFSRPEPPYARFTAVLHRYRDEIPDYSWTIAFKNPYETEADTYLLNIRNEQVGSSYPSIIGAKITGDSLRIDVLHNENYQKNYHVPLDRRAKEKRLAAVNKSGREFAEFEMHLIPHYLEPRSIDRFQKFYWWILNVVKG